MSVIREVLATSAIQGRGEGVAVPVPPDAVHFTVTIERNAWPRRRGVGVPDSEVLQATIRISLTSIVEWRDLATAGMQGGTVIRGGTVMGASTLSCELPPGVDRLLNVSYDAREPLVTRFSVEFRDAAEYAAWLGSER